MRLAVDAAWDFIEAVENFDELRYERKKARVKAALEGFSDEEIFEEIQARRGIGGPPDKSVKQAELETLVAAKPELGNDRPDGIFFSILQKVCLKRRHQKENFTYPCRACSRRSTSPGFEKPF